MTQESVSVAIKMEGGKVVLAFDREVGHIEIEPENCLDIAEAMSAAAFECKEKTQPVGKALKAQLVERHRDELIPRIALMLGSLRQDKKKSDGYLAEQFVSVMLAKVF